MEGEDRLVVTTRRGGLPPNVATLVGLKMPRDFPAALHDQIYAPPMAWQLKHPTSSTSWQDNWGAHFTAGWQGVGYRFLDCADSDRRYRRGAKRVGLGLAGAREQYRQDSALFGFFLSGQAVLENFHYAVYALGAGLDDTVFDRIKVGRTQDITTTYVVGRMQRKYPHDQLTQSLAALGADEQNPDTRWGEWRRVRNTFPHRMAPGRHLHVRSTRTGSTRTVSSWAQNIVLDEHTTATRRMWLAQTLHDLLVALGAFVQREFV